MKRYTCYQPDVEEVEVEIVQTMVVGERSVSGCYDGWKRLATD